MQRSVIFAVFRRRGLTLLGGSRERLYGALSLGDVKLYSIFSGNISVVPEHSDDLLLDSAGNEEGGVRLVFLCVIIDRQGVQPSPADWENRFRIMGYCVHVHCLRTGASQIVRVAVEDRLSDLYSRVRQLFVACCNCKRTLPILKMNNFKLKRWTFIHSFAGTFKIDVPVITVKQIIASDELSEVLQVPTDNSRWLQK